MKKLKLHAAEADGVLPARRVKPLVKTLRLHAAEADGVLALCRVNASEEF